jgi:hypothetical protein
LLHTPPFPTTQVSVIAQIYQEADMAGKRMLLKNGCVLTVDKNIGNFHEADVLI